MFAINGIAVEKKNLSCLDLYIAVWSCDVIGTFAERFSSLEAVFSFLEVCLINLPFLDFISNLMVTVMGPNITLVTVI